MMRKPLLAHYFDLSGLSVDDACARGQLSFVEADRVWLADGRFDPELLLSRLSDFRDSAGGQGMERCPDHC